MNFLRIFLENSNHKRFWSFTAFLRTVCRQAFEPTQQFGSLVFFLEREPTENLPNFYEYDTPQSETIHPTKNTPELSNFTIWAMRKSPCCLDSLEDYTMFN